MTPRPLLERVQRALELAHPRARAPPHLLRRLGRQPLGAVREGGLEPVELGARGGAVLGSVDGVVGCFLGCYLELFFGGVSGFLGRVAGSALGYLFVGGVVAGGTG
jgi:hypothetical protein